MSFRLSLFGAPSVTTGERSSALPCERRTQLVAYLALKRGWVGRAELAALLWPEQETKLALTNLRKALHRLQSFNWSDRIESRGSALRFDAQSDVHEFEVALRDGRLEDALAAYRGALLAGFDDAANEGWTSWLGFERDRLQTAWRGAVQQVLERDCEPAIAIDLAARLLESDPLDEEALRLYMQWLTRGGQLARARQAYRDFVIRLHDELGLVPGAELRSLNDALGGATAPARPSAAPLDDSFIGRAVELRRAVSLLMQDDCRLLTITGPGGVGKTRMAQRLLRECARSFADGGTLVLLDEAVSADEIGGRLAAELGVVLKGEGSPLDQVIDALRTRHALLVLDNFEQVVDAAPQLDRLFAACPRVKAIVTSRIRLALKSEWMLPLTGLPTPEAEDVDELESFDAVRLFTAAARRVEPGFSAAAEAAAIVAICQSVEGLPLALELAAAWTRVLPCRDIAAELERNADLLQATDGSHPARHASIQAVFEHSWRLLGERERAALARLSVFRGGFSPGAARFIGGTALPVLAALVDKSLLHREGARCYFHPLLHQFAHAKLAESFDSNAAVAAHARHFLRYLAELSERVAHAESEALRELDAEFENVRAAWRFGVSSGWADELARAAYCLMSYADHRGRRLEGLELLQEALDSAAVGASSKAMAGLAAPAAWLAYRLDRYAEAHALGMKTLKAGGAKGRRVEDGVLTYRAATILGAACMRLARLDEARDWLQQALDVAQKEGSPTNVAGALDNLGLITRVRGDLDEALRLYRLALLKHREVGDAGGAATCLNNQGVVHILRNELESANQVLQEARHLCERHGLPSTRCMVEINLANVALKLGTAEQAASHARKALEVSAQTGQRGNGVEARQALVRALLAQGDLVTARSELANALATSIAIGRQELLVHGIWIFAELLAAQGAQAVAARALAYALQQPALVGAQRSEAERQLATWGAAGDTADVWNGPSIDELAHRIVAEAPVAYSPLIAMLGSAEPAAANITH